MKKSITNNHQVCKIKKNYALGEKRYHITERLMLKDTKYLQSPIGFLDILYGIDWERRLNLK